MGLALISLLTGLAISAVAIYYSVVGLTAIFAAAAIPIMVMGVALEVAKLVATVWLKQNWKIAPSLIKAYLVAAVGVLMFITSMGIFGFLSKAHMDQSLVSGDVQSKIAVYDDKIKTAKENIDANRKALKQMDEAVDQVMARSSSETGADKAVSIRRSQQKERARLQSEIQAEQKTITALSEERAPIAAEVRKVEAEVGPIKYIAAFVYGDNPDANVLEKAVTWVIVIIVFVFDPLAVVLLLAAQYSFARMGIGAGYEKEDDDQVVEERTSLAQRLAERVKGFRQYVSDSVDSLKSGFKSPLDKREGDSPLGPDIVSTPTVTEPVGVIAQEVADVLPEAVIVDEAEPYTLDLDDIKSKLAQFVDAVKPKEPELVFTKFETPTVGFMVPKVNNAVVPSSLPNGDLNAPAMEELKGDFDELPFPIEQWNAMIAAAEEEVTKKEIPDVERPGDYLKLPDDPFLGQQAKAGDKNYLYNGREWIYTPVSGSNAYVQNEEQVESNLWQESRKNVEIENAGSLSQADYQERVQQAIVRDLVSQINDGKITAFDLTDEEAKAVEDFLKAENDSEDNPSQSA